MISETDDTSADGSRERTESTHREYVLDVRILERTTDGGDTVYLFESSQHEQKKFADAEAAELYADVYFDVNGFDERGVGPRGVPPEVVQAGRDTLVAYFMTWPSTDINWVASFSGRPPRKVRRYIKRLQERAESIRQNIINQDFEELRTSEQHQ